MTSLVALLNSELYWYCRLSFCVFFSVLVSLKLCMIKLISCKCQIPVWVMGSFEMIILATPVLLIRVKTMVAFVMYLDMFTECITDNSNIVWRHLLTYINFSVVFYQFCFYKFIQFKVVLSKLTRTCRSMQTDISVNANWHVGWYFLRCVCVFVTDCGVETWLEHPFTSFLLAAPFLSVPLFLFSPFPLSAQLILLPVCAIFVLWCLQLFNEHLFL